MNWFAKREPRTLPQKLGGIAIVLIVAALMTTAYKQPLWQMKLEAHNYPQGLAMQAYGEHIAGDVTEINTLNQYIGMRDIRIEDIKEIALFPYGIAAIILCAIGAVIVPRFRLLFALIAVAVPLGVLGFIQYYLYQYGHSLDPKAPLRIPAFTPKAIGSTHIWNFATLATPGLACWLMIASALLIGFSDRLVRLISLGASRVPARGRQVQKVAYMLVGGFLLAASPGRAQTLQNLQAKIDAAPPGSVLQIPAGFYRGPIRISKPISIVGSGMPEIRGNGTGDVVAIEADNVRFQGFRVRFSGKEVSDEAAGISSTGSNVVIQGNDVCNVYFGVHVTMGTNISVLGNTIHPGKEYGARAGHGVNFWNVQDVFVHGNRIFDARDGIILTYAKSATVDSNEVTDCRYGLHSMYSHNLIFSRNHAHGNLLGVALMYTDSMQATGNVVEDQRAGATPYGFLLKDLDNLEMSGNRIARNQVAVYCDGLSMKLGSLSRIHDNVIAGNERGLAVMSNATFEFTGNAMVDNLTDVYAEGQKISDKTTWTKDGAGNFWSQYHGFDRNADGIGDLPYQQAGFGDRILNNNRVERAFIYTPAHLVLETAVRMFPLINVAPTLHDSRPLMSPVHAGVATDVARANVSWLVAIALGAIMLGGLYLWFVWTPFHKRYAGLHH
jgi:nitrous oxidase accessory protein